MRRTCSVGNLVGVPPLDRAEPHRPHPTALIGHVGRMQSAIKALAGTHAGLPLHLSRSRREHQLVRGLLKRHASEAESRSDAATRKEGLVT
jgi:hypothetical protein